MNGDSSGEPIGAHPWPVMRGDAQNSGRGAIHRGPDRAAADTLSRAVASLAAGGPINATPVIADGDIVVVGSADGAFYQLDPGRPEAFLRWPSGNIIDSAACLVDGQRAWFASGDHSLFEWRLDAAPDGLHAPTVAPRRISPSRELAFSPTTNAWFEGNLVRDRRGRLYAGCDDFYLYCFDLDGEGATVRWAFPTAAFIWSAAAVASDDRTLYLASADMNVYAIDLEAAAGPAGPPCRWRYPLDNLAAASPALWTTRSDDGVATDRALVVSDFSGRVHALDPASGALLWDFDTRARAGAPTIVYPSAAIAPDGTVYLSAADGVVRAVAPPRGGRGRGVLRWEYYLGPPSFSSAALGPDPRGRQPFLLYVGGGGGQIVALDPQGRRVWSYQTAALLDEPGHGSDPALGPRFRAPAVNSSIAIGRRGLATATSSGRVVYLGYDHALLQGGAAVDTRPDDDYRATLLERGPCLFPVNAGGAMAPEPALPGMPPRRLPPTEIVSLRALHLWPSPGAPGGRRSGPLPLDPSRIEVTVEAAGRLQPAAYRLSAERTQVHLLPDPALFSVARCRYQVRASAAHDPALHVDGTLEIELATPAAPPPIEALAGLRFGCVNMAVSSPFIAPALDQVGIASLVLHVVVFAVFPESGRVLAYGYEAFDAGSAGARERDLRYLFAGQYQRGSLRMEAVDCFFELTALPTVLDSLVLTAALPGSRSAGPPVGGGLLLTARYDRRLLWRFLSAYRRNWLSALALPRDLRGWRQALAMLGRAGTLAKNLVLRPPWRDWGLLDEDGELTAVGTWDAAPEPPPAYRAEGAAFAVDARGTLRCSARVVAQPGAPAGPRPVAGLVLWRSDGTVVPLSDQTDVSYPGTDPARLELELAGWSRFPPGTRATAFLGLEALGTFER